jgi:hypothetical protein
LADVYCQSYKTPPKSVILDFDDTVDVVHGHQQLSLFNAHEDERCFKSIHVYDVATSRPVMVVLRPGKMPSGKAFSHSAVIPEQTRTGVSSFKLENPDLAPIFEALRAAGRHVIFLRETGEIAPGASTGAATRPRALPGIAPASMNSTSTASPASCRPFRNPFAAPTPASPRTKP